MAVTSVWPIRGRVDTLIQYVMNPEKTVDWEASSVLHSIDNVLQYTMDEIKTEELAYVTGINCNPKFAAEQFMATKEDWGKLGGRVCYHGIQSFRPGEVTAQQAHDLGVALAQELWGDRFEVVVATHCNTDCYHNHSTNYQSTGRELKTPDEMRTFDNDTALLFIRGERPIQDRKYDLTKHPNFHLTPEGGGEPYLHDRDSRSFASITLDQSLLDQAAQWDIDTTSFVLLSEEELEESFQEKENENHESVPEKRKLPHRKYPRPRQG